MSAEKSPSWLIDALYEGRDDEPSTPSGETLDSSQRAELASYEAMLSRVRPELELRAPRAEVSASILEAARKQAEVYASQAPAASSRGARRAPGALPDAHGSSSIWSRPSTRSFIQLAAVLCVCLGAGVILKTMQQSEAPSASMEAPAMARASGEALEIPQGVAPELAALADEELAPTEEPAEALAQLATEKPTEAAAPGDFPDYDYERQDKESERARRQELTLAMRDEVEESEGAGGYERAEKSASRRASTSKKSAAPAREAVADEKNAAKGEADWGSRSLNVKSKDTGVTGIASLEEDSSAADDYATAPAPEPASKLDSLFGGQEGPQQQRSAPPVTTADRNIGNAAPSAPLAKAEESAKRPASTASAGAPPADQPPVPKPSTTKAESKEAEPAPPISLAEAERSFARSDYDQTLEDSEAYLKRGIGTNTERARAMELKAQSLQKLGRGGEAQQVYEEIRKKYPDYFDKEKLEDQKKRSKAAPRKSTYDFDSESVMEEAAPSSSAY